MTKRHRFFEPGLALMRWFILKSAIFFHGCNGNFGCGVSYQIGGRARCGKAKIAAALRRGECAAQQYEAGVKPSF